MISFYKFLESIELDGEKLSSMNCDDVEKIIGQASSKDRDNFVKKYSWSVLCKEIVDAFKKYHRPSSPIYDVMSGTGFWAGELAKHGIRVIASDKFVGAKNKYGHKNIYHPVEEKDALDVMKEIQILADNRERTGVHGDILLAWPPYNDPIGYKIVKMVPVGGRVFYVGEGLTGSTGDDSLHNILWDTKQFKVLDQIEIPNFKDIHDNLWIYERIGTAPY